MKCAIRHLTGIRPAWAHWSASTHLGIVVRHASSEADGCTDGEDAFPATGAYSPRSIEARTSMPRKRPAGVTVPRSIRPPKSEEDFYLEGGAYAYGTSEDKASPSAARGTRTLSEDVPKPKATRVIASRTEDVNPGAALAFDPFSKEPAAFPLVRISQGQISLASLPAFIKTYQLKAVPAFGNIPGCLSASLLIDGEGVSLDGSPAAIMSGAFSSRGAVRDGSTQADGVIVSSMTVWKDLAALNALTAPSPSAYVEAMQALAPYFKAPPTVTLSRQAGGAVFGATGAAGGTKAASAKPRAKKASKKNSSAETASKLADGVGVGPELGLR